MRSAIRSNPAFSSLANGVETGKLETGMNRMSNFNLALPCFIDVHTYYLMLLLDPFHTEINHIQPRLSQRIDIIGYKSFDTMI